MIGRNKKLRKISDRIFQEAEPPEDRSRPLEWRRSFNFVRLPLKNVKILSSCTVHDTDFSFDKEKTADPVALVKPNVSASAAITGILDGDRVRDSVYFAEENKEEEGNYFIERGQGETQITLKSGEPTKADERTRAGLFWGNAFRMNIDPGEDYLCFDLSIPKEQMELLISSLRKDDNATIEIGAHLLSYTFEVDDFLREHYYPQDILINDSTVCFVSWVSVTSKIGKHYVPTDSEHENEKESSAYEEELSAEQRSHQELMQVFRSYLTPLRSLVTAIWVLIVVIALYAFLS